MYHNLTCYLASDFDGCIATDHCTKHLFFMLANFTNVMLVPDPRMRASVWNDLEKLKLRYKSLAFLVPLNCLCELPQANHKRNLFPRGLLSCSRSVHFAETRSETLAESGRDCGVEGVVVDELEVVSALALFGRPLLQLEPHNLVVVILAATPDQPFLVDRWNQNRLLN